MSTDIDPTETIRINDELHPIVEKGSIDNYNRTAAPAHARREIELQKELIKVQDEVFEHKFGHMSSQNTAIALSKHGKELQARIDKAIDFIKYYPSLYKKFKPILEGKE